MSRSRWLPALVLAGTLSPALVQAFCGFYVASGDAKLFNQASQVVLVRDGDRTVLTMSSDFKGAPSAFALVVPVPTVLERGQIHVAERDVIDHLDAFSAPRLVEYFDEDPCQLRYAKESDALRNQAALPMSVGAAAKSGRDLGVTIEARYAVGEYDILILSATQSHGLETWLRRNRYNVPPGASRVLSAYLKQGMKFFVARVNLKAQQKLGFAYLRPLQIAYESPKFVLPVRLGMANADGPQEMFVYALTKQGRVEPVNYRSVKLPSDVEVPEFVQADFGHFYRDLFTHQTVQNRMGVVFTEYAWDMSWCDPCASPPLSNEELRRLGVWWAEPAGGGAQVFLTRLHARYDRASFPEDLMLQVTSDRTNFQGRYVIRHEWKGDASCDATRAYARELRGRREKQAQALAALTGWPLASIQKRMAVAGDWSRESDAKFAARTKWWDSLWSK